MLYIPNGISSNTAIAFWLEPCGFEHPRFVVASVAMDWAMSSCATGQGKGHRVSEYSAAHWCSSLKVVLVFHPHTMHYTFVLIHHPSLSRCLFWHLSLHRKGWWTERWAVKEKKVFCCWMWRQWMKASGTKTNPGLWWTVTSWSSNSRLNHFFKTWV